MTPRTAQLALACCMLLSAPVLGCSEPVSVCAHDGAGSFPLISHGVPASVFVETKADPAVQHAAAELAADLRSVSSGKAGLVGAVSAAHGPIVLVGTLGQSPVIDQLVQSGKIKARDLVGSWEAYRQVVVDHPFPGVSRALVVIGADRRGTVFGIYDISRKMGVSPWHWWADVPAQRKSDLFVTAGSRTDRPKVKYRGFFINDEEPSFGTWARSHFGGINAKMYGHVFDLLLRLKGNYLWPAMWGKAFNADDPQNMVLADQRGVIMGTSHHEPMMRAQAEWHRNQDQGITGGAWDYTTNAANLREFWRGGIERMRSKGGGQRYDSIVTIGMRGDGDKPMAEGTATDLLERIVSDQRRVIADVTGRPADETPQLWALYKEVQDYYDHGMKVPDDVTLLFADDNWGQIRRLPTGSSDRPGGYGVYYHFDYVGGPRNYTWLNTNQIQKVWQQMDLAYQNNAKKLWIVNVGDIKPMEFPLSFFLDQAWDPEAMTPRRLATYAADWATETFGAKHGHAIGSLLTRYATLVARRKPELVDADSFPLGAAGQTLDGGEFGRMVEELHSLRDDAERIGNELPADQKSAYFELVLHPASALSNIYDLYYDVAWNRRLAAAADARANGFADAAEAAFRHDQEISDRYHAIADGKWAGMMKQVHIGYTSWHEPKKQTMPEVVRVARPVTAQAPGRVAPSLVKPEPADFHVFEAPDFARTTGDGQLSWRAIPALGRTKGAVVVLPQGRPSTRIADNVRIDYDWLLRTPGDTIVQLYMVPTLDTRGKGGLRLAVSIDDLSPHLLTMNLLPDGKAWADAVSDNAYVLTTMFPALTAGRHTIKIWRIDDNVVVQKVVVGKPPVGNFYLGPPPQ